MLCIETLWLYPNGMWLFFSKPFLGLGWVGGDYGPWIKDPL